MAWFPRTLGVATAVFGVAVTARPKLLATPLGLSDEQGKASCEVTTLCRAIGVRDVVSGVAMASARSTPALRQAIALRVASDVGDAHVFGILLRDAGARGKAIAGAGAWAGICALSALATRER